MFRHARLRVVIYRNSANYSNILSLSNTLAVLGELSMRVHAPASHGRYDGLVPVIGLIKKFGNTNVTPNQF